MWRAFIGGLVVMVVLADMVVLANGRPQTVSTRMRNLVFHLDKGVELRVADLSGALISQKPGTAPVFDDVQSYVLDIRSARVSMTPESLTNLMNNHVFAAPDAPLKHLELRIENSQLLLKGTLKKGVAIPFTMRGTLDATADGKIRIHPTTMKAAGFVPKGVLDFFGLELDRLVKLKRTPAVSISGNDFLLDPEQLLPPPQIRGRLTNAWIEGGLVHEQFGSSHEKPGPTPPDPRVTNYMYYRGGVLRFGKLTMQDTDLLLIDADPKDPFDFSPERYNEHLVAGYSKNTPDHGLKVYMPDLNDLEGVRKAGGLTPR